MVYYCQNHPLKKAINKCHVCQKYFCDSCLVKGLEYYYCKKADCMNVLESRLIPAQCFCPSCSIEITLDLSERINKKYHCPGCEKFIDLNFDPPKIIDPKKYKYILTTMNQADIALIQSILDGEKIDYFIFGQNFLTVDPMIQGAKLYVYETQYDTARELINQLDLHILGGINRIIF